MLSGNSLHNREWIYIIRDVVAPLFDECYVHEYAHWDSGKPLIDLDYELAELKLKYRGEDHDYAIFAKSIGSVLAVKAIATGALKPRCALFVGLPVRSFKDNGQEFVDWLQQIDVPLVFMQNDEDPYGSHEEVKEFLAAATKVKPYVLVKLPGKTHDYDHTELLFNAMNVLSHG